MCAFCRPSRRGTYFMKFVFCEVLNLVNVLGQIYFTDLFLGFQFTQFGRDVLSQSELDLNTREDPMHRVFPKVAKVTFYIYLITLHCTLHLNRYLLPVASGFSGLYFHMSNCSIYLLSSVGSTSTDPPAPSRPTTRCASCLSTSSTRRSTSSSTSGSSSSAPSPPRGSSTDSSPSSLKISESTLSTSDQIEW